VSDGLRVVRTSRRIEPTWATWAMKLGHNLVLHEVVTMLFNKRRRALHDFVAGTVVVSERRQGPPNKRCS